MSKQIDYYNLDKLEAASFQALLKESINKIEACVASVSKTEALF